MPIAQLLLNLLQVLDKDFTLPIGKAKVMRPGKDVTIVAFSKMVGFSLEAADQLAKEGIDAEVGLSISASVKYRVCGKAHVFLCSNMSLMFGACYGVWTDGEGWSVEAQ
jgi:hypothetical protein